ncbi:Melanocortin receptor 5 [Desmophyllum pertusum]|uniref:Melanocortin receptor 5 n=1 Tax=Desmophyllum pertusum TaxID=174260 RepID=A0A9X0CY94_9CNID|nr:Melanocortin receptor 5 [Desmophyllum pertusum]
MNLNSTAIVNNSSVNNDCGESYLSNSSALDGLHCQDLSLTTVNIIVSVVLYSIIAIGGSFGNMLVLLVIRRTPNLKTVCGVLIANLAMADLLVTAVAIPLVISVLTKGFVPVCSLNTSMFAAIIVGRYSCAASVLILAAMSMDRCWAVCDPLRHKTKMTSSKLKAILLFIWLASLILPILEVALPRQSPSFSMLNHIIRHFGVISCCIAIVTSGLVTVINVRCTTSRIRDLHENGGNSLMFADLRERNKKVAKTILLVVALFLIFWLPFTCIEIYMNFVEHYRSMLHFWSVLLGLANSAVNPCIYFYRQRSYRQALKVLLRGSQS